MANALTIIKDANGKEINVDMTKIADINGDIGPDSASTSLNDSRKNRVQRVHDVEYVDTNGAAIDHLKLLKDMQSGAVNVVALDVEMEATHSGPNHNYCIYYEDSMEKDAVSFVNPFKKPILKNHNSYSGEPMGRIQQAWHGVSALTEDRSAIHLKCRITDSEAIPKFLDGRYGTVSIGGSMGTVTCNICGKTILKDGKFKFCGHWRGETYKDQVCYWGAKDIEYHEVSTVNSPADDFAQIMKVTVITDKDEKKEGSDMNGNTNANAATDKAEEFKKSICDMIDGLLGKGSDATSTSTATDNNGGTDGGTGTDTAQTQTGTAQDGAQTQPETTTDATKELEKVKQELADALKKNEELTAELNTTKDALAKSEETIKTTQAEANSMKDMCLALASANKEMLADSVIAKEKANGTLTDDKVEDRKKELVSMSMKDLTKASENVATTDSKPPRATAQVENPALADTSKDGGKPAKDSNGVDADTNKQTADGNKRAKRTVDDFANDIVGKLFK